MDKINLDIIKFDESGLIPAVIQDVVSGKVLMLAYMNRESLETTLKTGTTWFYSRSRKMLWNKGETSGHIQKVFSIAYDCDEDSLLVKVKQIGAACHTNNFSCFYRDLVQMEMSPPDNENKSWILREVFEVILERKQHAPENSYVAKKMKEGIDRILKKVGEEAGEVIIAAKNKNAEEIGWEMADLIFHLWMTLAYYDLTPDIVYEKLIERRK